VWTAEDQTVAAGHGVEVDPARWQAGLDELLGRVAARFPRVEPRRRARAFVLGLLADLPRKNCWTIAEHAGDASPDGMQHLLARAVWDHDGVRDDLRAYLVEHLGDPEAVLVVDETGDLKKGARTVGVQRQYTGTAGRIENAQVAVYLVYASDAGHALVDRELDHPGHAGSCLLVVAALTDRSRHPPPSGLVGLTCKERQHLFAALLARPA
jgi:SRSO17 transposase